MLPWERELALVCIRLLQCDLENTNGPVFCDCSPSSLEEEGKLQYCPLRLLNHVNSTNDISGACM